MNRSIVRRAIFVLAVFGLLAGPEGAKGHAEAASVSPASTEASYGCYLDNVAAHDNRFHVRCSTSPGDGIWYFAHRTSSASGYNASRMLAVGQTAYALGRNQWSERLLAGTVPVPDSGTGQYEPAVGGYLDPAGGKRECT